MKSTSKAALIFAAIVAATLVANSAPIVTTVYVTSTGSKYHQYGCQYLSKSCIAISLTEAKTRYAPCQVCRPPSVTDKEDSVSESFSAQQMNEESTR